MKKEKELDPYDLPFELDNIFDEIMRASEKCPGVYHITARELDQPFASEYYVVAQTSSAISKVAKTYGQKVSPNFLLYNYDQEGKIIEYEIDRYCICNKLPSFSDTPLSELAAYGMELYPDYFGPYPVPIITPNGYTTRSLTLTNGVFWLETDQCETFLAICYPIWEGDLSDATKELGKQTPHDKRKGIHNTLGYLFFSHHESCLALFELSLCHEDLHDSKYLDFPALMNCIWKHYPHYAASHNFQNQLGLFDSLGLLLNATGTKADLTVNPNASLILDPNAGTEFILF